MDFTLPNHSWRLSLMFARTMLLVAILLTVASTSQAIQPIHIGSRRELFVDRFLIETMSNTTLQLHTPIPAEVVLERERPWEGISAFGYMTVLKDGDAYRMYYRSYPSGEEADGSANELTCYAESSDGIQWNKPELGLFEFNGSTKNNIVLANAAPYTHNFSPFIDTRPAVPSEERFKAIGGISPGGLAAFASPDGVHWTKLRDEPVIKIAQRGLDSQNVAFWSETEKCYVCYLRTIPEDMRAIARVTSNDFVHWSNPVQMQFDDRGAKPLEHLYTNQTQAYFRAPHIYIATPARFMEGRRILNDDQVKELGIDETCKWLKDDCSDTVLMTSRGGNRYDRTFMEAWIRPGLGSQNWVSRSNYAALGIVPTGETEMSIYVSRHNGQKSAHVLRYTLRTDGFASIHAPYQAGEILTRPIVFSGNALEINYSTSAAGSVLVEIQNEAGEPISGFTLGDCVEIIGDEIGRTIAWKSGSDMSALAGRPVRLRFVMKEADLYSMRFTPKKIEQLR